MDTHIPPLKTIEDCLAFAKASNPKKKALTIEVFRKFPGCEQYSEEEATQILQTFDHLATIMFEAITSEEATCQNHLQVVASQKSHQLPSIHSPKNKAA